MNRSILTAVFAIGFSCIVTQLALMREMLGVFAGNELVLGVALGNWLLLMGLGAALGRRVRSHSPALLAVLLILTAVFPPAQILVLRGLRRFVFLPGEAIGVIPTVLASFLLLFPYCLAAGFFLAVACSAMQARSVSRAAGNVYAMDSIGSVAGGVLFSFVLVLWLDHAALLAVPALVNLAAAGWLAWNMRGEHPGAVSLVAASVTTGAAMLAWVFLAAPDAVSTARQFPGQRVLFKGNSPYGRLVVTESGGQTNVIENGIVLVSSPNIEQAEETCHFALAQRPDAKRVLLIGGALSGAAREILRYDVSALDCVELDPLITRVGHKFLPAEFNDRRLLMHEVDARRFVRKATTKYDVIIVALPDPATAQINRFFTHEFFAETRRVLRHEGVLSFAIGRYGNFAGPDLSRVLSCARNTALESFRNVMLVPGDRVYFLASDGALTTDFWPALERSGVATRWVTRNYLAATLTPDRLEDVERAGNSPAPLNHDFAPVLYYLHLRHWASQFESTPHWLLILLGLGTVIYVARLRPLAGLIFASGFAASGLEVVLLLAIQTLAGSVYRQVAWVVTMFMAGLAFGAWGAMRRIDKTPETERSCRFSLSPCSVSGGEGRGSGTRGKLWKVLVGGFGEAALPGMLALCVVGCAALLSVALPALARLNEMPGGDFAAQAILLLFAFCLAGIVGAQFPLATAFETASKPAARLYTADFVGASLGALLTSTWLLPLAGVAGVCWIAAGLNLIAALRVFRMKAFA